jgi:IS5 family transposase
MFRTIGDGPAAWEPGLPAAVLRMPEDLARVDALLDDPVFFAPFAPNFHPVLGRPSTPVEWYLRLMFLKFRHGLGFESLCAEVSDSISWRRFCRIAIPRQATTSPARKAIEHGRRFRKLVKRRTGCEGRISYLKRGYGWDRTRLDGRAGAAIWCGHGVFAHNPIKISALAS